MPYALRAAHALLTAALLGAPLLLVSFSLAHSRAAAKRAAGTWLAFIITGALLAALDARSSGWNPAVIAAVAAGIAIPFTLRVAAAPARRPAALACGAIAAFPFVLLAASFGPDAVRWAMARGLPLGW